MSHLDNRFVSYAELKDFFLEKPLKEDLINEKAMGICSVADVLLLTEEYKKGNPIPQFEKSGYDRFEEGPVNTGRIFVAELAREQLCEALFENENDKPVFWLKAANMDIQPGLSISLLALKETSYTSWFTGTVFRDMCRYHELPED